MNNTVLKVIAGLLAVGAIVVAIIGIRLSRQPEVKTPPVPTAAPASIPTEPVVVAARSIKAGQALGKADITVKGMANPPQQALRQDQDALGKVTLVDIPAGTPLQASQFAADSMASLLRPGERAFAIHVDEVTGIGGFAKPGDHVDVVSYQAANKETNDNTYAQIAVHNARLLSFGDATQLDAEQDKPKESATPETLAKSGSKSVQEIKDRRMNLHSAVLAIPESDVTKLMLVASSGQLRLALRPLATVTPDPLSIYPHNAHTTASAPRNLAISMSDIAPGGRKGKSSDIIIQEGSKEHPLAKNEGSNQP